MKRAIFILSVIFAVILSMSIFSACGEETPDSPVPGANQNAVPDAQSGPDNQNGAEETPAEEEPTEPEDVPAPPVPGMVTVTRWYPSSSISEGLGAPMDGVLLTGKLIGAEEGWGEDPDTGNEAAFDGDPTTFYDPAAARSTSNYCGVRTDVPYILTEIRIMPREGFLNRFRGASIWGTNEDAEETFDLSAATQIWVSSAVAEEEGFQVITADQFIEGANTGFTHFIYFNQAEHGDVAEVELYGNPK